MNRINSVKNLGDLIRQVRKSQGLTQEQLAALCGVGVRFLRELEHGKETCHMGKALTIVESLGIELLAGKRERP